MAEEADLRTAATTAVAIDRQVGKLLAEREARVIQAAVASYNAFKLTPEMALALWGQMAELQRIDSMLESNARKAVFEVEKLTEAETDDE
jgi:hypothetical protein